MNKQKKQEPEWAHRARHIPHKPNWIGVENHIIPTKLWELGEVFFPIRRRRKGWNYPHHQQESRFKPTDEKFNAYIEAGCGYGIACADDLVVVDADAPYFVEVFKDELPETLWQITGSRTGAHFFLKCPDLKTRQTLYFKILDCWSHIGEVKADPHGYVVGPGSIHPSGNKYGPLEGDSIAEISKDELMDIIDEYQKDVDIKTPQFNREYTDVDVENKYEFYELDADDVVPWLEPNKRVAHPGHGSSTWEQTNGRTGNFMKNDDRETFTCWRHDFPPGQGCGLNANQLLAQIHSGRSCDEVRRNWSDDLSLQWHAWKQAVDDGHISPKNVPYNVVKGLGVYNEIIESTDEMSQDLYWELRNTIKIEVEKHYLPEEKP